MAACSNLLTLPSLKSNARSLSYYQLNDSGDQALYADGTSVKSRGRYIEVAGEAPNVTGTSTYERTGRGIFNSFLKVLASEDLIGKRVLDVGAGNGVLVRDLRAQGVDAYGTDIFLTREQLGTGYLFPADTANLPFQDKQFDVAISSISSFNYSNSDSIHLRHLQEISRVVKPGGLILIFGINWEPFQGALRNMPNLEVISSKPFDSVKLRVH